MSGSARTDERPLISSAGAFSLRTRSQISSIFNQVDDGKAVGSPELTRSQLDLARDAADRKRIRDACPANVERVAISPTVDAGPRLFGPKPCQVRLSRLNRRLWAAALSSSEPAGVGPRIDIRMPVFNPRDLRALRDS